MRRYYIDFKTWELNAESEEEAREKAIAFLKEGRVPYIHIDDTEEEEPFEEDSVDYIELGDF